MKIKICGITKVEEAKYLIENDVDYVGVVMFYEKSKRNVEPERASEIATAFASTKVMTVAVVVSPTKEQLRTVADCGFDFVQIHGELDKETIYSCPLPILKAFNVNDIDQYVNFASYHEIKGFVFDASEPGSGKTFDWNMVKELKRRPDKMFILAGGLNSENVSRAIAEISPDVVDASSSLEMCSELPDKDPAKIEEFVRAVRG